MTHMNLGQTGAKRQAWEDADPSPTLMFLMRKYPNATYDELAKLLWDEVQSDQDVFKCVMLSYWYPNNYRRLRVDPRMGPPSRSVERARAAVATAAATVKTQVESGIKKQARIMLLDWLMPNGKKLGECTGRDCQKLGGWLTKISDKVKPREKVGDVLTETDLQSMYERAG